MLSKMSKEMKTSWLFNPIKNMGQCGEAKRRVTNARGIKTNKMALQHYDQYVMLE